MTICQVTIVTAADAGQRRASQFESPTQSNRFVHFDDPPSDGTFKNTVLNRDQANEDVTGLPK